MQNNTVSLVSREHKLISLCKYHGSVEYNATMRSFSRDDEQRLNVCQHYRANSKAFGTVHLSLVTYEYCASTVKRNVFRELNPLVVYNKVCLFCVFQNILGSVCTLLQCSKVENV